MWLGFWLVHNLSDHAGLIEFLALSDFLSDAAVVPDLSNHFDEYSVIISDRNGQNSENKMKLLIKLEFL